MQVSANDYAVGKATEFAHTNAKVVGRAHPGEDRTTTSSGTASGFSQSPPLSSFTGVTMATSMTGTGSVEGGLKKQGNTAESMRHSPEDDTNSKEEQLDDDAPSGITFKSFEIQDVLG